MAINIRKFCRVCSSAWRERNVASYSGVNSIKGI